MSVEDINEISYIERSELREYASLIQGYNEITNISGYKDIDSIHTELVMNSIEPLKNIHVPRGTCFIDIGTGGGIPGIPLLLYFKGLLRGVLLDSNRKKINFVNTAAEKLHLGDRVKGICGRAEDVVNEGYRSSFDFAVSRAFAHPYMALEYGMPFVAAGGWYYIYYNVTVNGHFCNNDLCCEKYAHDPIADDMGHAEHDSLFQDLMNKLREHAGALGGHAASPEEASRLGISKGLLFIKDSDTPLKYPRKNPVVKREVDKMRAKHG